MSRAAGVRGGEGFTLCNNAGVLNGVTNLFAFGLFDIGVCMLDRRIVSFVVASGLFEAGILVVV